jgi:hypothetical protein
MRQDIVLPNPSEHPQDAGIMPDYDARYLQWSALLENAVFDSHRICIALQDFDLSECSREAVDQWVVAVQQVGTK